MAKLEAEKQAMEKEKQANSELLKQLSNENTYLKQKIADLSRQEAPVNKYPSQPRSNRPMPPAPLIKPPELKAPLIAPPPQPIAK